MEVAAAQVGALNLGGRTVWPPVVLAPMAGITNRSFRMLCREHSPTGLYVNEMVTARGLVERDATTWSMVRFGPEESPRSLQLYGTDAESMGAAVRLVREEDLADHVDLNFGCPVPKVTRKGGGAALPYKRALFGRIVHAAVASAAGELPVTVKMRIGIDSSTTTYIDAGRIAQDAGVAWVALHARTAAQHYSGSADWTAIARLKEELRIPVLGNGDIWEAADAARMMADTGCDGVVVGRGCLGRPWLFGNLAAVMAGMPDPGHPGLAGVVATMRRHARLMAGEMGEHRGVREIRKHIAWYLKGFAVGPATRSALGLVSSLRELDDLLASLETDQEFPREAVGVPRGRTGSPRRVSLPAGWLDDPCHGEVAPDTPGSLAVSGG
jgi:nifR3 family TIM-barrel protein